MPLATPDQPSKPVLSHFSLEGKVAAVTGGARGIGLEVVRALAEAGASVALIYTSSKDADQSAESISNATGQKVVAYKSDVRSKAAITATIDQVASDFGKLDICVANAGIAAHQDSLSYAEEDWHEMMRVNLDGAMFTAQAAGNIFKKQGPGAGSVIFTASVSAILVNVPQTQCAYNASKAAVVHLAKSLAVEWTDFARVNCVSPGFIETESEFSTCCGTLRRKIITDSRVVLSVHPQEWRDKWFTMIPGGRLCDPSELKGVSIDNSLSMRDSNPRKETDVLVTGIRVPGIKCLIVHDRSKPCDRRRIHASMKAFIVHRHSVRSSDATSEDFAATRWTIRYRHDLDETALLTRQPVTAVLQVFVKPCQPP